MLSLRPAHVRGRFYPETDQALSLELARCLPSVPREPVLGLVLPHAGWRYSGGIAGAAIARSVIPETAILLCPNHTGQGARAAVWSEGAWESGTTLVPIAAPLAAQLTQASAALTSDRAAHLGEHAIEVLLPLLQHAQPALSVVPVCLGPMSWSDCAELGAALARVVSAQPPGNRPLLVASTDMTHFLSAEKARAADAPALAAVQALDAQALYACVTRNHISMCGFLPTCAVLVAARALGATRAELVQYGHSGLVTGDASRVVAYASFRILA